MSGVRHLGKALTLKTINPNLIEAQYAVRGIMAQTAAKIRQDLEAGTGSYPFDEITECHVGNPQALGQKPVSFYRQVLSALVNRELLDSPAFPEGVKARARYYIKKSKGNLHGYSEESGFDFVRQAVAQFLERRDDGIKSDPNRIILTDGASNAIDHCFQAIMSSRDQGVMIPIPQYPLYSALIRLYGLNEVPYYLDEESGWQIKTEDLQASYDVAQAKGIKPRAIVIINPGNPTGQVLTEDTIKKIVEFAHDNQIVIFADEVYQQNIYREDRKFVSFKKVLANMPKPYSANTDLISFNSTSKGILGECGARGGYIEWFNIDPEVETQLHKLKSLKTCANINGQLFIDMMVRPPTEEENGKEVTENFKKERSALFESLKRRSNLVYESMNEMKGITCNKIEGAMYAFPRIHLPKKAIQEAKSQNLEPDLFYTLEALKATGICTVQGSGFKQKPGEYHFRITTLVSEDKLARKMESLKKFNDSFMDKYA